MAILIADDDPVQRRLLEAMVQKFGYEPICVDGGDAAAALLTGPDGASIDCVILDLVMPDLDGLGVLARLRQNAITVPVIVQTAHGGIDNVVSAMRAGAVDFVVKPVGGERLQVSLRNALNLSALEGELARMKHARSGTLGFGDIVTKSPAMQAVLRMAEKAAASTIPVLIAGESGVGKELIARAIHGSGERRAKPFVAVNCGAMPENLVESILFGHEKGSFTGATERHTGKFVEASGGTLLLDEVGELPPAAQVKLLRAIQEGEVEPVGARRPVKVDVRIVSATNRDLIADVKAGRFREDLFYRLHVFPITVPPLRARPADIPALARHFLARFAAEEGKRLRAVTPEALRLLTAIPLARQYPPIGERGVSRGRAGGRRQPGCRRVSPNRRANRRARCWRKRRAGVRRGMEPLDPWIGELDLVPASNSTTMRWPRRSRRCRLRPTRATCWRSSTPTATCARSRRSRPTSSGTPLPIIAARCRKSRASCKSDARRSTASWMRSASTPAAAKQRRVAAERQQQKIA